MCSRKVAAYSFQIRRPVGISDLRVEILEGELLGLDLEVDAVRAYRVQSTHIEPFEDVEHLEGGDALSRRRYLVDLDAPVVGRDGIHPGGLVLGEVLLREVPARFLRSARDAPGYLPVVEGVGPALGDGGEGGRQVRLQEDLSGPRRSALQQKGARGGLVPEQKILTNLPVAGEDLGDGVAVLGHLPGGLEQPRERQIA